MMRACPAGPEKPKLLLASIEAVRNKEDSEVCFVFDREEKQIYASPEAMDEISQALRENTDPDATSWDVLDKVIPYEDADYAASTRRIV